MKQKQSKALGPAVDVLDKYGIQTQQFKIEVIWDTIRSVVTLI